MNLFCFEPTQFYFVELFLSQNVAFDDDTEPFFRSLDNQYWLGDEYGTVKLRIECVWYCHLTPCIFFT